MLIHGGQLGLGAFLQKKLQATTAEKSRAGAFCSSPRNGIRRGHIYIHICIYSIYIYIYTCVNIVKVLKKCIYISIDSAGCTVLYSITSAPEGDPQLHPGIRTACYEEVPELLLTDPPDLIALLMPNFMRTDVEDPQQGYVPDHVLEVVPPDTPVAFSSRFELQEKVLQGLGLDLILPQTRCPFSAGAGDPHVHYDDNGWIFATRATAVSRVLRHAPPLSPLKENRKEKVKTLFWGIVDLKYDAFKPVLDRIQVLETGRNLRACRPAVGINPKALKHQSWQTTTRTTHERFCVKSYSGDGRISKFSGQTVTLSCQKNAVLLTMSIPSFRRWCTHPEDLRSTVPLGRGGCGVADPRNDQLAAAWRSC